MTRLAENKSRQKAHTIRGGLETESSSKERPHAEPDTSPPTNDAAAVAQWHRTAPRTAQAGRVQGFRQHLEAGQTSIATLFRSSPIWAVV